MRIVYTLFAVAAVSLACERAREGMDSAADEAKALGEQASEIARDAAADVSAAAQDRRRDAREE